MARYFKLVRDNIPEIMKADGKSPKTRIIQDDAEYLGALFNKDLEESAELKANPNLEELADKLEVLYAIGRHLGFSPEDIELARAEKAKQRGGFGERIFLESSD